MAHKKELFVNLSKDNICLLLERQILLTLPNPAKQSKMEYLINRQFQQYVNKYKKFKKVIAILNRLDVKFKHKLKCLPYQEQWSKISIKYIRVQHNYHAENLRKQVNRPAPLSVKMRRKIRNEYSATAHKVCSRCNKNPLFKQNTVDGASNFMENQNRIGRISKGVYKEPNDFSIKTQIYFPKNLVFLKTYSNGEQIILGIVEENCLKSGQDTTDMFLDKFQENLLKSQLLKTVPLKIAKDDFKKENSHVKVNKWLKTCIKSTPLKDVNRPFEPWTMRKSQKYGAGFEIHDPHNFLFAAKEHHDRPDTNLFSFYSDENITDVTEVDNTESVHKKYIEINGNAELRTSNISQETDMENLPSGERWPSEVPQIINGSQEMFSAMHFSDQDIDKRYESTKCISSEQFKKILFSSEDYWKKFYDYFRSNTTLLQMDNYSNSDLMKVLSHNSQIKNKTNNEVLSSYGRFVVDSSISRRNSRCGGNLKMKENQQTELDIQIPTINSSENIDEKSISGRQECDNAVSEENNSVVILENENTTIDICSDTTDSEELFDKMKHIGDNLDPQQFNTKRPRLMNIQSNEQSLLINPVNSSICRPRKRNRKKKIISKGLTNYTHQYNIEDASQVINDIKYDIDEDSEMQDFSNNFVECSPNLNTNSHQKGNCVKKCLPKCHTSKISEFERFDMGPEAKNQNIVKQLYNQPQLEYFTDELIFQECSELEDPQSEMLCIDPVTKVLVGERETYNSSNILERNEIEMSSANGTRKSQVKIQLSGEAADDSYFVETEEVSHTKEGQKLWKFEAIDTIIEPNEESSSLSFDKYSNYTPGLNTKLLNMDNTFFESSDFSIELLNINLEATTLRNFRIRSILEKRKLLKRQREQISIKNQPKQYCFSSLTFLDITNVEFMSNQSLSMKVVVKHICSRNTAVISNDSIPILFGISQKEWICMCKIVQHIKKFSYPEASNEFLPVNILQHFLKTLPKWITGNLSYSTIDNTFKCLPARENPLVNNISQVIDPDILQLMKLMKHSK